MTKTSGGRGEDFYVQHIRDLPVEVALSGDFLFLHHHLSAKQPIRSRVLEVESSFLNTSTKS